MGPRAPTRLLTRRQTFAILQSCLRTCPSTRATTTFRRRIGASASTRHAASPLAPRGPRSILFLHTNLCPFAPVRPCTMDSLSSPSARRLELQHGRTIGRNRVTGTTSGLAGPCPAVTHRLWFLTIGGSRRLTLIRPGGPNRPAGDATARRPFGPGTPLGCY